ncbi:MAG: hypothetical protein WA828_11405 [Coleofasciculaceae cyanobacterium]
MQDSLIDSDGETLVLILSFVLVLGIVITVGYVSRNLENAITFTIISMAPLFFLYLLFRAS